MQTENKVLMFQARESLAGKWGLAVGGVFVYMLLSGATSFIPFSQLILGGPLYLGLVIFFLAISRKQTTEVVDIFKGFNRFVVALFSFLLVTLFTLLWMLLLIVPGIIAALSYSQTFFILAEDTSISALDAIAKSKKMMMGYKWKFFCLGFRFFGWGILAICTLGIGFLWLTPYMIVSYAKFYDEVKANYEVSEANQVTASTEAVKTS